MRVRLYRERMWNHLARARVSHDGIRLMVSIGKYSLQMYVGGGRTKD